MEKEVERRGKYGKKRKKNETERQGKMEEGKSLHVAEVENAIGANTWEAVESGIRGRRRLGDLGDSGDWEAPKIGEFGILGDSGNWGIWEKRGIQRFGRLGNSGDSEDTMDCS